MRRFFMAPTSNYISPTTDYAFKKIFGSEQSKNVTGNFLSDVLELDDRIEEINFLPQELLPGSPGERLAIVDVRCVTGAGERFIVEMQRNRQRYFKDRTVFYSTFPITEQAQIGNEWQFRLEAVYCIGIVDFSFSESDHYFSRIKLQNETTHEVFYDKLSFIFLELPKFNLSLSELSTPRDKWMYFFKHLAEFDEIPEEFTEDYLIEACEIARYAGLSPLERYAYEQSLKSARDSYAIYKTVEEESLERGIEQGFERGREAGRGEGREQGREQGERQAKQDAVLKVLLLRFDSVPESIINRITSIRSLSCLDSLFENALTAQTLDEIDLENPDG